MSEADIAAEQQMSELIGRGHVSGGTHADLFAAVARKFGAPTLDLAATGEDTLCALYIGPEADSLKCDWHAEIGADGLGWCNPPSGDLQPWALKMRTEAKRGARFCALLPLSLDADWCWKLLGHASVYVLNPRMCYDGLPIPLAVFAFNLSTTCALVRWNWRVGTVDL